MAQRFEDEFKDKLDIKAKEHYTSLDLTDPTKMTYTSENIQSPLQIAAIQAGVTAEIVQSLTTYIQDNTTGITGDQRTALDQITSKSHLASKQLQELSHQTYQRTAVGGTVSRELQIPLPTFGLTDTLDTSALKLLPTFDGDATDDLKNCNNLRQFLTELYDQCRSKVTERTLYRLIFLMHL